MLSTEEQKRLKDQILTLVETKCKEWEFYEYLLTYINDYPIFETWSVKEQNKYNYQTLFYLIESKESENKGKAKEMWDTIIKDLDVNDELEAKFRIITSLSGKSEK